MPARRPTTQKAQPEANYRVRIRMYQQGLGDCFLLSFPKGGGKQAHVLIDFGIILGTTNPGVVMTQVAENIRAATNKKLDVLAITHEHWDHVSGFDEKQARGVFDDIQVEQLWLAWTEEEGNPLADRLRKEREGKKEAALAAREAAQRRGLTEQANRMTEVLGLFGAKAANADDSSDGGGGTAGALAYLKGRYAPVILQTGGKPVSIPGVDGVRVYVLGPPVDHDALKKANPHKGEGYGLASADFGLTDAFLEALHSGDERGHPFARGFRKPIGELQTRHIAAQKTPEEAGAPCRYPPEKAGLDWYADPSNEWRSINDAWLGTGERLALQLDSATNNTSLVLAFELDGSDDVLLFVGDAQAGNWRSWDSHEWTIKEKNGEERNVTAADLLKRTIFYKVGHHGSHNATLCEKGLERMTSARLAACIPVDTKVAHGVKGWTDMPLPAIRTRLDQKCAVVFQSDEAQPFGKTPTQVRWERSSEQFDVQMKDVATKEPKTVRRQCLYVDYFV